MGAIHPVAGHPSGAGGDFDSPRVCRATDGWLERLFSGLELLTRFGIYALIVMKLIVSK